MNYYYYPLSTHDFVFDNIFATESISPISYYKKRGFGFDYFYKIPALHAENAILLYNKPPKYTVKDGIKFLIAIKENCLLDESISLVQEGVIAYYRTIYFNKDNIKIYFFSDKDRKITCLKSEERLTTKGYQKYAQKFSILTEADCEIFQLGDISKINLCDEKEERNNILSDKKYNHYKGLIYGLATGFISIKSKEEIQLRKSYQEITNAFAELKNRYESYSKEQSYSNQVKSYGSRSSSNKVDLLHSLGSYEQKLKKAISDSESLFFALFPNEQFSEKKLIQFLYENFKTRFSDLLKAKELVDNRIINDEIDGTEKFEVLKRYYLQKTETDSASSFYEALKTQSAIYILNAKQNANWTGSKEDANEAFKNSIFKLGKFTDSHFLNSTSDKRINLTNIKYNNAANEIEVTGELQNLQQLEIEEYVIIANTILSIPKTGKSEARKEVLLALIETIGNNLLKSKKGKTTDLYKYMSGVIRDYNIDRANSIIMKNFVAFVFNADSMEKLQAFLDNKGIPENWIAYSFWCAFNGFANTSRNFLKPIFETTNTYIQDLLDSYLKNAFDEESKTYLYPKIDFTEAKLVSEPILIYDDETLEVNNIEDFYNRYISMKYKMSFDFFKETISKKKQKDSIAEFKEKANLKDKEAKEIWKATRMFFVSGKSLFG